MASNNVHIAKVWSLSVYFKSYEWLRSLFFEAKELFWMFSNRDAREKLPYWELTTVVHAQYRSGHKIVQRWEWRILSRSSLTLFLFLHSKTFYTPTHLMQKSELFVVVCFFGPSQATFSLYFAKPHLTCRILAMVFIFLRKKLFRTGKAYIQHTKWQSFVSAFSGILRTWHFCDELGTLLFCVPSRLLFACLD